MQKKLTLKVKQRNPDSPPELIRQYQLVDNVLDYYSRSLDDRPANSNDDYFFRNLHKAHGFSFLDSWTNVLKWRT
jgi:hypothetical protein